MSEALKKLQRLEFEERYRNKPNYPDYAKVKTRYSDRTANGLTKCVLRFLQITGNHAERVNVTGRPIDRTKVVTNALGQQQRIGSIEWLPTTGMKGSGDIHAVIKGRFVAIEVKMKDRQSEAQKEYQKQIEQAGGLYWLVRSFDEFIRLYNEIKARL